MRTERHESAAAFLAAARAYLLSNEIDAMLVLGIAGELERHVIPGLVPQLLTAHDGDRVVAVALRTPPYPLIVHGDGEAALGAVAEAMVEIEPALPGVTGHVACAETFARLWPNAVPERRMHMRFRLLRTVTPPPRPAPGELRRARPDEAPRLCDWVASFTADTGMAMEDETRELREHRIGARIAAGDVYVWQHGDEVVSLNSVAGKTTSGIRINMVYTPPAQRGHGYASASVAALAQRMLDGDAEHGRNSFVCLYADADAPAVNRIYARVGFEHVYDSVQIRFAR